MKIQPSAIQNEGGNATVLALLVLCLLTIVGISGVRTANIEKQSVTNEHLHKLAFFAGEAGREYVEKEEELYGGANLDSATPHYFPNTTDPTDDNYTTPYDLGSGQSFSGSVEYIGPRTYRGTGDEAGTFFAHTYKLESEGVGPRDVTAQIAAGFYRKAF